MTFPDRRRTDPPAAPAPRMRSQRELVTWSLLTCPDDRAPRNSR
jgi:hypothetical protein